MPTYPYVFQRLMIKLQLRVGDIGHIRKYSLRLAEVFQAFPVRDFEKEVK